MTTEEFEDLLEVHGNDIYRFCIYIMQNRENAEDLYQDTVLTAFRKAYDIDIADNPKAYLLSVAVKLSHNFFRKEKRKNDKLMPSAAEMLENIPNDSDIQASAEDKALKAALKTAVLELAEKYRVPIVLYYYGEHDIADISAIMKLPQGTVKSRLHKARELLAEKLKKEGFDNE